MTIIASYQRNDVIVMVGDLMVSGGKRRSTPLDVPTRFSPGQPAANPYFVGLAQKVLLLNDHLTVAWAGSQLVAKHLLRTIKREIRPPYSIDDTPKRILAAIYESGLLRSEIESVSFIFVGADPREGRLFVQDYLTWETILGGREKVKYAGSGRSHFFDRIAFQWKGWSGEVNDFERTIASFIGRISVALYEEVISNATHDFFYGGGFEAVVFNSQNLRFEKQPLTFAFWMLDGDELRLVGPILSQNYREDDLLLHRLVFDEQAWHVMTFPIGALFEAPVHHVGPIQLDSFWTVHYVIQPAHNKVGMILKKGEQKSLRLRYDEHTSMVHVDVSDEFRVELANYVGR